MHSFPFFLHEFIVLFLKQTISIITINAYVIHGNINQRTMKEFSTEGKIKCSCSAKKCWNSYISNRMNFLKHHNFGRIKATWIHYKQVKKFHWIITEEKVKNKNNHTNDVSLANQLQLTCCIMRCSTNCSSTLAENNRRSSSNVFRIKSCCM